MGSQGGFGELSVGVVITSNMFLFNLTCAAIVNGPIENTDEELTQRQKARSHSFSPLKQQCLQESQL